LLPVEQRANVNRVFRWSRLSMRIASRLFFLFHAPMCLRMTREGKIRGYAYKGRSRHVYRYRLSEVSEDFSALASRPKAIISQAAPASQRRKSNG
jgi:hypothetical protein